VELFEKLITILTPFQKIAITDDSRTSEKSYTGYVGIKNLGSTCYMNSIVQQFYMLPKLRSGVLAATQSFLAAPSIEPSKAELDNGRVLCEMGKLFAFLKRSQRSYYDPKDFASANDIDIRLQQDADEFFNVFCDKLEQALSSTPQSTQPVDVSSLSTS
jgi:ubiquitin carboxyl-terminal hydrolase 34